MFSIGNYVDGKAYEITRLQRAGDGAEWSEYETLLADNIREGLLKHPTYSGRTYRNLDFDSEFDKDNYDTFILENELGKEVTLKAFTSASKNPNGYPSTGKKGCSFGHRWSECA